MTAATDEHQHHHDLMRKAYDAENLEANGAEKADGTEKATGSD